MSFSTSTSCISETPNGSSSNGKLMVLSQSFGPEKVINENEVQEYKHTFDYLGRQMLGH